MEMFVLWTVRKLVFSLMNAAFRIEGPPTLISNVEIYTFLSEGDEKNRRNRSNVDPTIPNAGRDNLATIEFEVYIFKPALC